MDILGLGYVVRLVLQHVDALILAKNSYSHGRLYLLHYILKIVLADGWLRGRTSCWLDVLDLHSNPCWQMSVWTYETSLKKQNKLYLTGLFS